MYWFQTGKGSEIYTDVEKSASLIIEDDDNSPPQLVCMMKYTNRPTYTCLHQKIGQWGLHLGLQLYKTPGMNLQFNILEFLQRGRLSHDLIIEPATEAQVNKRDSLLKTVVKHKVYRVKSSHMPHASKADVGKITTDQ